MDRDQARVFFMQVCDAEEKFLEELKDYKEKMSTVDDWESISRDFAPRVKAFYNSQLEQWQRFYLGLDSANVKLGFSVMHTAQKKERKTHAPTIPHSVYGELKYKMKINATNAKLSATGGTAAREIIQKKLQGEDYVIETKGQGGVIGGGLDERYEYPEWNENEEKKEQEENKVKDKLKGVQVLPKMPTPPPPPPPPPPTQSSSNNTNNSENNNKKEEIKVSKAEKGAETKSGETDPQLATILQRRKDLYKSGKW